MTCHGIFFRLFEIFHMIKKYTKNILTSPQCYNLSLGLVTKVKACKGASQEGIPRVTSHAPGSAKECEGVNLHIPK